MFSILLYLFSFAAFGHADLERSCKCTPEDSCWPVVEKWNSLNASVSGALIRNVPLAASCYPGPYQDNAQCAYISSQKSNSSFQALSPVGYCFPIDNACPVLGPSTGNTSGTCELGPDPVYTINATRPEQVSAGIRFAEKNKIRLVIRNTGHDILGRSEGYGSLQVWIKYIQKGILFQDKYISSNGCTSTGWTGGAVTIGGGYIWKDVYKLAFERNLIVVGGGDPSVGCIGGYTQGGGHSPASHNYGLAADQVLEAEVVLANGQIVTASPCNYTDLYFAIRGGGGGTYGVVTSMTVKVYPSTPVVAQSFAIMPLKEDKEPLLEAITEVYQHYVDLMDAGFSGYGSWSINAPMSLFANHRTGYVHAIAAFNKSLSDAQKAFDPLLQVLKKYDGTSLSVSVNWFEFPTYAAYYQAMSGVQQSVGSSNGVLSSRMFDKRALTDDPSALRSMIGVIAGNPAEQIINSVSLVGGGKVLIDGADPYSGINPAWRSTYILNVVARHVADERGLEAAKDDMTYNKGEAMSKLTPLLGCYMNEANRFDPLWATNFYGTNYVPLALIKKKYDPTGLFYCTTCVGSPEWHQKYLDGVKYGPLCRSELRNRRVLQTPGGISFGSVFNS